MSFEEFFYVESPSKGKRSQSVMYTYILERTILVYLSNKTITFILLYSYPPESITIWFKNSAENITKNI